MTCFGNASADRVTQAQRENPEQWSIPDNIIYELVLYTRYQYSKAPPGINDCFVSFVFWNRFTCKIILISIQPQERNLRSQQDITA